MERGRLVFAEKSAEFAVASRHQVSESHAGFCIAQQVLLCEGGQLLAVCGMQVSREHALAKCLCGPRWRQSRIAHSLHGVIVILPVTWSSCMNPLHYALGPPDRGYKYKAYVRAALSNRTIAKWASWPPVLERAALAHY